jgi:hypothetical protein
MLISAAVSLTSTCLAAAAERTTAMWTVSALPAAERRKRRDAFRLARLALRSKSGTGGYASSASVARTRGQGDGTLEAFAGMDPLAGGQSAAPKSAERR